jgi:hypothetical protein
MLFRATDRAADELNLDFVHINNSGARRQETEARINPC